MPLGWSAAERFCGIPVTWALAGESMVGWASEGQGFSLTAVLRRVPQTGESAGQDCPRRRKP